MIMKKPETEKPEQDEKMSKKLTEKVKNSILEWISGNRSEDYHLGVIISSVDLAKSLDANKDDLIVKIPFSDLMKSIRELERKLEEDA